MKNGATWSWLLGILLTLLISVVGYSYMRLQAQVDRQQETLDAWYRDVIAPMRTDITVIKITLDRIERSVAR